MTIIATIGNLHRKGRNNFHLLRLIAALAVIYGHSFPIVGSGDADWYQKLVGNKFIGGVAVDVFFVASGFLIAASLERSSWTRYLWARALRILPALVVAVALTTFVLGAMLTTDPNYWRNPQTWHYFYNNSFMLHTEYFLPGVFESNPDKAMNGSLWSLPVEFRLYLIFFVLSIFGLMQTKKLTYLSLFLLLLGIALTPRFPIFTQYANWVNESALFFAGGLVWKYKDEIVLSPVGLLVAVMVSILFYGSTKFAFAYSITLIYAVFYFVYAVRLPVIHNRDLSYGVYLYGWPAQQIVYLQWPQFSPLSNTICACALALVFALFSWECIERPMLKLKNKSLHLKSLLQRHKPYQAEHENS